MQKDKFTGQVSEVSETKMQESEISEFKGIMTSQSKY